MITRDASEVLDHLAEPVRAKPDLETSGVYVYPLDEQLYDAGLFGGKQLIPERIDVFERGANIMLAQLQTSTESYQPWGVGRAGGLW